MERHFLNIQNWDNISQFLDKPEQRSLRMPAGHFGPGHLVPDILYSGHFDPVHFHNVAFISRFAIVHLF